MLPRLSSLLNHLALIFAGAMSFSSAPLQALAVACDKATNSCRVARSGRRARSRKTVRVGSHQGQAW